MGYRQKDGFILDTLLTLQAKGGGQVAGNHTTTVNHNKNILVKDLGLRQFSNTTIFKKRNFFVLSPSIQNSYCWFDLRKVNIDRFNKEKDRGYLLIRFFDKFLLADLGDFINNIICDDNFVETKVSGVHWKFNIRRDNNKYIVVNQTDKRACEFEEIHINELKKIFM